jgi:hypothetical protein
MSRKPHPEAPEPLVIDPCRFCRSGGVELDIAQPRAGSSSEAFVFCRQCKAAGPTQPNPEKAVDAWNIGVTIRRKEEPKP